jgi:hypothetical protein
VQLSAVPVYPVLHAQMLLPADDVLCAGQFSHVPELLWPVTEEYFPAVQSSQAVLPVVALYLQAWHAEHGPTLGPVAPALQLH